MKQETIEKRALFGRKIANLKDLKDLTQAALKKGQIGSTYQVDKEVSLTNEEFQQFAVTFSRISPGLARKTVE